MPVTTLLFIVGAVCLIALSLPLLFGIGRGLATRRLSQRELKELEALRELKDTLRDTAYTHMELDSNLSAIFIDEIKAHERRLKNRDDRRGIDS